MRFLVLLSLIFSLSNSLSSAQDSSAGKDNLYSGREFKKATANPQDDPQLPNVLLIGDSISLGYTIDVRKQLHGKADVFRIPTNGRNAAYGAQHIDGWLKGRTYDVIHFNWGLWDLCYRHPESKAGGRRDKVKGTVTSTPESYAKSLEQIVAKLTKTGATLIWCATTPVPEDEAGRRVGDDLVYNRVAAEIMKSHKIAINDLHAHALKKLPGIASAKGNVHYTATGSAYLAEKVTAEIQDVLPKSK